MRLSICVAIFLSAPAVAGAQLSSPALDRAHAALRQYDAEGESTLNVVRDLNRFLHEEGTDAPTAIRREAAFLRAVVTADLFLLAHHAGDEARLRHVAELFDIGPHALAAALIRELHRLESGVYAETAHDALAALNAVEHPDQAETRISGPRTMVVRLDRFVAAAESEDPVTSLATFSVDPCSEEEACPSPYDRFEGPGRRAIAAMTQAFSLLEEMHRMEAHGEPFIDALGDTFTRLSQRLRQVELHPEARLNAVALSPAGPRANDVAISTLVLIQSNQVCFGGAGHVRFDGGQPQLVPATEGVPVLPDTTCTALPRSFRPFPTPISSLVEAFAPLANAPDLAIGGSADAPAHLLSRVWLSAQRAGVTPVAIAGRADDGSLVAVRAAAVRGEDGSAIQVYVRLGGHTVAVRGGGERQLPRLRTEGGLAFDYTGLQALARDTRSTSVRYMHSVPLGSLTTTAFHIAPSQHPVTFVLP